MAVQTVTFGTRTALTITLASLGNGAYRESTEVDNSSDLAVDGILHGVITVGTTPTANTTITVYVAGSDGTTTRVGNLTGADSTITPSGEQAQFEVARVIPITITTSNVGNEFYVGSIAALFGGVMPKKFSVIVLNSSGVALNATGGNHSINYTPVKYTIA